MLKEDFGSLCEIWKNVPGYEDYYQISNFGRVKSLNFNHTKKEGLLNPNKSKNGYLQVTLYRNKKKMSKYIHRLVAEAFLVNPLNLPQVNHKDECKTNNCVSNLEWCTQEYNHNCGSINNRIAKKLGKEVVCIETGEIFQSSHDASRQLGLSQSNICKCCNGHRKKCGNYHWLYLESLYIA